MSVKSAEQIAREMSSKFLFNEEELTPEERAACEASMAKEEEERLAQEKEERRIRSVTLTSFPARYCSEWDRPTDAKWVGNFKKISESAIKQSEKKKRGSQWAEKVLSGGIIALVGGRGTGKTRMAAEVCREYVPHSPKYMTAMELFLRIRSTYGGASKETEMSVIKDVSDCPLLVLDEIQERGNTEWEDRLLTHIIDQRYGNDKPTILIANLTKKELAGSLGASIVSRLQETGGIIELTGPSHRTKK